MKIAVYINEESLQGQLCDSVAEAINNLFAVINTLASYQSVEVSVLTSSAIFSKRVCAGTGLTLAQLDKTDHDLFMKFREILDKGKYWDKAGSVQQSSALYLYRKQSVNGTSVAEARESAETGSAAMLISLLGSDYAGRSVNIEKDGIGMEVPHAMTTADVFDFLAGKGVALKYDRSKFLRVDDMQTVLVDATQFAKTNHKVQGRSVYERIGKDEYWYVDNLHKDDSVHLEVFRMSDGLFLGTCDIEDVNKFKVATKREQAKKEPLKF